MFIIITLGILFFALAIVLGILNFQALKTAKLNYLNALARLKEDPANASLRQETLSLGRAYANLTRNKKGQTLFDEMALMNDINAACASTQHVVQANALPVSALPVSGDIEGRLNALTNLKNKGLIDADDFSRRKQEIISQI